MINCKAKDSGLKFTEKCVIILLCMKKRGETNAK